MDPETGGKVIAESLPALRCKPIYSVAAEAPLRAAGHRWRVAGGVLLTVLLCGCAPAPTPAIRVKPARMSAAWARKAAVPSVREALARVRRTPNDPHAVRLLGYAYYRAAQYDRAAELLRRASHLAPGSHATWFWLAESEMSLGRWAHAETAWRFAIETARSKADCVAPRIALVRMLFEASEYDPRYRLRKPDAESLTEEALKIDPRNGRAHYELAWFEGQPGDYARALRHFRTAARLFTDPQGKASSHAGAALALRYLGRLEEARAELGAALRLDAQNEQARRITAQIEPPAARPAAPGSSSETSRPGRSGP